MGKRRASGLLAVWLAGLMVAGPVHAADAPLTTLVDLSPEDTAAKEIAAEVLRSLKRSKQVRFRDLDDSLNLGGEEMIVSAVKSAEGLVKSGQAKLAKKNFDDAAEDFDGAVGNYLTGLAHVADPTNVTKALGLLAVAQWLGGETKAAAATFARSVQFDPKYEQDFTEYPPGVQKLYDEQRKAVLARPKVDFEVRTDPQNARVVVNGKSAGLSNAYVKSLAGEQFVTVYKNGYARKALVAVVAKSDETLTIDLQPARRKSAFDNMRERMADIFDGAVEPNDLTEAEGIASTPFAIVVRATGTRDKMKVELALANLAGRQVVNRLVRDLAWLKRDKDAIDKLVDELLKTPEVPIEQGPQVRTKTVLTTWWFWTLVVGVAGGSVAAYELATHKDPVAPTYQPGQGGLLIRF